MQNEIEHDAHKTIRSSFCTKHNLHYDSSRKGCVLCSREKTSKIVLLIALVILLLLVIFMVRPVIYPDESPLVTGVNATEDSNMAGISNVLSVLSEDSQVSKLNPEIYRRQVEALEQILYKTSPANLGDMDRVGQLAAELGQSIMSQDPTARPQASEITFWGAGVGASSEVGYQVPELGPIRDQWEKIRSDSFQPAPWFQTSSAELIQQQTRPEPQIDPVLTAKLRALAQRITVTIQDGKQESLEIGEITGDYMGPEEREIMSNWQAWGRRWRERVDTLGRALPPQPSFDGPTEIIMAHQKLGDAINQLRYVTHAANDYGVPFLYERDNHFSAAQFALDEASAFLKTAREKQR